MISISIPTQTTTYPSRSIDLNQNLYMNGRVLLQTDSLEDDPLRNALTTVGSVSSGLYGVDRLRQIKEPPYPPTMKEIATATDRIEELELQGNLLEASRLKNYRDVVLWDKVAEEELLAEKIPFNNTKNLGKGAAGLIAAGVGGYELSSGTLGRTYCGEHGCAGGRNLNQIHSVRYAKHTTPNAKSTTISISIPTFGAQTVPQVAPDPDVQPSYFSQTSSRFEDGVSCVYDDNFFVATSVSVCEYLGGLVVPAEG